MGNSGCLRGMARNGAPTHLGDVSRDFPPKQVEKTQFFAIRPDSRTMLHRVKDV
jgi:hypothetical protein